MSTDSLDRARGSVLDRMERAERNVRLAVMGGALVELLLFAVAFLLLDWHSRVERLVFIFAVLGYTIIVLGLIALGGHVSRSVGRVLAALEARADA